jgi:hydrogenase maturation protease
MSRREEYGMGFAATQAAVAIAPQPCVVPRPQSVREVLMVGLGNTLLADDGVGVHAARRLALDPQMPAGLQALDGGTLGFRLMDAIMRSDAVIFIDAAELSALPGTVRLLEQDSLSSYIRRGGRMSAHEAGLVDLLTLARLDGWDPAHLAVVAIQPHRVDWDEQLTDGVALAMPAICSMAISTALRWQASA